VSLRQAERGNEMCAPQQKSRQSPQEMRTSQARGKPRRNQNVD
jgi:hypothetical protein